MFNKLNSLRKWRRGETGEPYKLFFRLTEKCNLKCVSCSVYDGFPKISEHPDLTSKEALNVIDQAAEMGVLVTELMGGEAMLDTERFISLIKKIKGYGMRGELTTNGTLVTDDIAALFVELGWEMLTVSLDSPTEEINDYLRGVTGAYKKTVAGLKSVVKHKKRLGKKLPDHTIQMVVSTKNVHQIEEMVRFANSIGVKNLSFIDLVETYSSGARSLSLTEEQRKKYPALVAEAKKLADNLGMYHNLDSLIAPETAPHEINILKAIKLDAAKTSHPFYSALCFVPFNEIVVFSEGTVAPCMIYFYGAEGGKFNKYNIRNFSLKEIWQSELFKNARESMRSENVPHYCMGCCTYEIYENRVLRALGLYEDGFFDECESVVINGLLDFNHLPELVGLLALLMIKRTVEGDGQKLFEKINGAIQGKDGRTLSMHKSMNLLYDTSLTMMKSGGTNYSQEMSAEFERLAEGYMPDNIMALVLKELRRQK